MFIELASKYGYLNGISKAMKK